MDDKKCNYCGQTGEVLNDPRQRAYKQPVDNFISCRKCWALKDDAYYKRIDKLKQEERMRNV